MDCINAELAPLGGIAASVRCAKEDNPSWAVGDGGEDFPFVVSSSQAF
jgi:hypothetical protein